MPLRQSDVTCEKYGTACLYRFSLLFQRTVVVVQQVVSLWVAIDDCDDSNGCMKMVPFTGDAYRNGQDLPLEKIESKTDNSKIRFDLQIPDRFIPTESVFSMALKRGYGEFHTAYTLHMSPENLSDRRRCAWIVRYCPAETVVVPGRREMFGADYELLLVR